MTCPCSHSPGSRWPCTCHQQRAGRLGKLKAAPQPAWEGGTPRGPRREGGARGDEPWRSPLPVGFCGGSLLEDRVWVPALAAAPASGWRPSTCEGGAVPSSTSLGGRATGGQGLVVSASGGVLWRILLLEGVACLLLAAEDTSSGSRSSTGEGGAGPSRTSPGGQLHASTDGMSSVMRLLIIWPAWVPLITLMRAHPFLIRASRPRVHSWPGTATWSLPTWGPGSLRFLLRSGRSGVEHFSAFAAPRAAGVRAVLAGGWSPISSVYGSRVRRALPCDCRWWARFVSHWSVRCALRSALVGSTASHLGHVHPPPEGGLPLAAGLASFGFGSSLSGFGTACWFGHWGGACLPLSASSWI